MFKLYSLRLKVVSVSAVIILFFGTLAISFVFFRGLSAITDQSKEDIKDLIEIQSTQVDMVFDFVEETVENIATSDDIVAYVERGALESENAFIVNELELHDHSGMFSAIYIMDPSGLTVVSTDPTFTGKNYGFREYFKKSISGEPFVYVARGVTSKKVGYYFSHPIRSADHEIIAVLVGKANTEYVHAPLNNFEVEEGDIIFTDQNGVILFTRKEDRLFNSIGELTEEEKQLIETNRQFDDLEISPIEYQVIKNDFPLLSEPMAYDYIHKKDKEEEIITAIRLKDYPFFLIIEKDANNIREAALKLVTTLGSFIAVMIALAILTLTYYVSIIFKPIEELEKVVRKIGKGDYGQRVHVETGDELERFGKTINTMAKEVQETIQRRNKIDRMKSEFVSIASHQLSTPLGAIKLLIEAFKKIGTKQLTSEQYEYFEDIEHSTEQMIRLVNDLLNVSRIDSGRLAVDPHETDVVEFIQTIIDEVKQIAENNHDLIIFNKPSKKIQKIPVDTVLLRQVILNLLSNAIRYSKEGRGTIIVTLSQDENEILISVKDTGIGIDPAEKDIFTKFYRTDSAKARYTSGSGLGLYVSKMILKISGGKIWYESEGIGKGTTFFVTFPNEGMEKKEGEVSVE